MSDAAIKAALDAAGDAVVAVSNGYAGRAEAAAAIAAFLRALPDWHEIEGRSVSAAYLAVLAAAVEAAAHDR